MGQDADTFWYMGAPVNSIPNDAPEPISGGYELPGNPAPQQSPDQTPPEQSVTPRPVGSRTTKLLGGVGRGFISTGVLILLFVAYQLWGTGIQEAQAQNELRSDFEDTLEEAQRLLPSPLTTAAPFVIGDDAEGTADEDEAEETDEFPENDDPVLDENTEVAAPATEIPEEWLALLFPEGGEEVASIEIPKINVDKVVVEGVQVADLRKGPGRYSSTAVPGETGNAAIAGHRTTYGAPFHDIDQLVPGDEIIVTNILGRFTYEVIAQPTTDRVGFCDSFVPGDQSESGLDGEGEFGHFIVDPSDTCVLDDWGDNRLTLTACHPKFSARQRIVVTAVLVGEPVDAPDRIEPIVAEELGADEFVDESEAAGNPGDAVGADPRTGEISSEEPTEDTGDSDTDEAVAAGSDFTEDNSRTVVTAEDLDEGLGWDYSALQPAVLWMIAALVVWFVVGMVAKAWRKWPTYALGIVPFAILLFTSFEQIDRLLPAY